MKKLYLTFVFSLALTSFIFAGEPVPGAEVFVEQEPNEEPMAFQQTGSSGTITFDHLDKGVYSIYIHLPKLEGKLIKGREKVKAETTSVYDANKKAYYIREPQGFFTVKFDGIKKIAGSNISPAYEKVKRNDDSRLLIARFTVTDNSGEITLKVEAITPKEFESKAKRVKHDTAKNTINNIR